MKIDTGFFKDLNKLLDRQFKTKIILLFLLSVVSIFFDLVGISMVIPMVLIIILGPIFMKDPVDGIIIWFFLS